MTPVEEYLSLGADDKQPKAKAEAPKASTPVDEYMSLESPAKEREREKPPAPGAVKSFLHGAASLGDTVLNAVPTVLEGGTYAASRFVGNDPTTAQRHAKGAFGWLENPIGHAAGITDTPGYQNEGSHRAMQFISENISKGAEWLSKHTGLPTADVENMVQSLTLAGPKVGKAAGEAVAGAVKPKTQVAGVEPTLDAHGAIPSQYGSVGASGSHVLGRLSTASEELRADAIAQIEQAQKEHGSDWGNHVHWDALNRHLNADSLPVPGRLTQGQATRDAGLISQEWNGRSVNGLGPAFDEQNSVMRQNLQKIREGSTPDVYSNSHPEHSHSIIEAYKELHAKEKGAIDAKWDAIRKVSSDKMIFDASQMMQDAQAALKKQKLTTYDPGGQLSELVKSAKVGGMTADEYVHWRQNLGRVAREGGNEGAAASAMLEATNNSKLLPDAAQYRAQVNEALADGRALHIKLANDPAYKAVADGTASVKDFANKYIVQGKPEKVANMRDNLVGNDGAHQTIRAVLLDTLRDKAALNDKYEGNFAGKSFNKALDFITPNARLVFQDGELQHLRALGDYAADVGFESPSGFKNRSNTATEQKTPAHAMALKAGSMAAGSAEAYLAAKTGGLSVPIVSALKEGAKKRAEAKAAIEEQERQANYIHESTRPAAGLIKKRKE